MKRIKTKKKKKENQNRNDPFASSSNIVLQYQKRIQGKKKRRKKEKKRKRGKRTEEKEDIPGMRRNAFLVNRLELNDHWRDNRARWRSISGFDESAERPISRRSTIKKKRGGWRGR